MKRILRKVAVAFLILLGILAVLVMEERVRGRWALARWKMAMAAKGEVLEVDKLIPSGVKGTRGNAEELKRLVAGLTNLANHHPPFFKMAAPGKAVANKDLADWPDGARNRKNAPSLNWITFSQEFDDVVPVLESLRAFIIKKGFSDGDVYSNGFANMPVTGMLASKQTAQVLAAAVAVDLHNGRLASALDNLDTVALLTRQMESEHLLISQLVRIAMTHIAFTAVWQALQVSGWTQAQLRELQQDWQEQRFIEPMVRCFEMERAMNVDQFQIYRESAEKRRELVSGKYVSRYLQLPLWRAAWIQQDELNDLHTWQAMIDEARSIARTSWKESKWNAAVDPSSSLPYLAQALGGGRDRLGWYDRFRFLVSGQTSFLDQGSTMRGAVQAEAYRELAVTAIALKRYELQQGALPAKLEDMTPNFLPQLPRDPMDGKPLRYQKHDAGKFTLYSVGVDGHDDGGDPAPLKASEGASLNLWLGKDAVWPEAATAEEIREYEAKQVKAK